MWKNKEKKMNDKKVCKHINFRFYSVKKITVIII